MWSCCVTADVTGAERATEPKVMNPPMVHSLATPPKSDPPAAYLVAAACGDGTIAIWDFDKVQNPLDNTNCSFVIVKRTTWLQTAKHSPPL